MSPYFSRAKRSDTASLRHSCAQLRESLTGPLSDFVMEAAKLARPAHFDISVGYPAVHVLSEAARLNIAHIVVGAENKRLAIGSAQHRIAVMAQCAVTLVR